MVRNYVRKTDRQKWDAENMRKAVKAVLNGHMGFLRASASYEVPKSTLERRVKKARETINDDTDSENDCAIKRLGHFKAVFTIDQENELVTHVKSMQARLFGITGKELRILAFELAERNNIKHPFDPEIGMAGKDWLDGFLKRHPDLSYRRPEPTSAARAMGFNKVAVNGFFDLLEKLVDKHALTPDRIFNVDETGVSTVPKSQSKIIALKGQKQVGCLTSGERGQLVTAEICFSATGTYVPPMLIFARKRMKNELLDGAPAGFWGTCSDNGWITTKAFFDWFKAFVAFTKPTKEKPILLLLDGHASHTKNLELIEYAREHNVILLCTPPHCTHKLQPLDVSFMKPLSTYYSAEVKKWLREHPGRVVTPFQVGLLFGRAYLQAATMVTAINGFRKCGIWPLDRNVFTDADFLAAETTNTEEIETDRSNPGSTLQADQSIQETRLIQNSESSTGMIAHFPNQSTLDIIHADGDTSEINLPAENVNRNSSEVSTVVQEEDYPMFAVPDHTTPKKNNVQPSTSFDSRQNTPENQKSTRSFFVTPDSILTIPKQVRTEKRKTMKRGKSAILTESPYKNDLMKEKEAKDKKEKEANRRKAEKKGPKKTKKKEPKKSKRNNSIKKRKIQDVTDSETSNDEDDDCVCLYCGYLYSNSTEGWVMCIRCREWAHNSCAGVDEEDEDEHICAHCMPD